jgi:hypothetical protein
MDFFERTAGYMERVHVDGRRTFCDLPSKEIKEKFPNFESLDTYLWDEADIWDCPMDLTILPLKDLDLKGLQSLHNALQRADNRYYKRGVPLHEKERRQTHTSLVLVEQWIYYRKIIAPKKRRGAEKPEKYYRSIAVQERELRKERCRNGYDQLRYFGLFWNFFFDMI